PFLTPGCKVGGSRIASSPGGPTERRTSMSEITFTVNGRPRQVADDPETPLLWVLRDSLRLTRTKYGCGIAQCGACTVHVHGRAPRPCLPHVGSVAGRRITTIEGLSPDGTHPVQKAWVAEQVPQCGSCQPGMLMTAADLLARTPKVTDADIDAALDGH